MYHAADAHRERFGAHHQAWVIIFDGDGQRAQRLALFIHRAGEHGQDAGSISLGINRLQDLALPGEPFDAPQSIIVGEDGLSVYKPTMESLRFDPKNSANYHAEQAKNAFLHTEHYGADDSAAEFVLLLANRIASSRKWTPEDYQKNTETYQRIVAEREAAGVPPTLREQ